MSLARSAVRLAAWFSAAMAALALMLGLVSLWGLWWAAPSGSGITVYRGALTVRSCPTGAMSGIAPGWRTGNPDKMGIGFSQPGQLVSRQQPGWLYDVTTAHIVPRPIGTTGQVGFFLRISLMRSALLAGCGWLILFFAGRVQWRARRQPGRCAECGYDLKGLDAAAACPECGTVRQKRMTP